HFESRENPAKIRAMIAVVKKTDVPAAAQGIQKLEECAWALGKLEPAHPFMVHSGGTTADHVAYVKLRHFVLGQIGRLVTVLQEIGLDLMSVITISNAEADEDLGPITSAESVVEFRNDPWTNHPAEFPERAGTFRNSHGK